MSRSVKIAVLQSSPKSTPTRIRTVKPSTGASVLKPSKVIKRTTRTSRAAGNTPQLERDPPRPQKPKTKTRPAFGSGTPRTPPVSQRASSSRLSTLTPLSATPSPSRIPRFRLVTPRLQSNSAVTQNQSFQIMATPTPEKMPACGARDAPRFDQEKPRELLRFFKNLEDQFKRNNIVDSQEKKEFAGRYADVDTEIDWKGMRSYAVGKTWEEHREEIIASYPEASGLSKGSLKNLERLCKENRRLSRQDISELTAFKRKFQSEVSRLESTTPNSPPSIVSNRELVGMVLQCFEESFRAAVTLRLDTIEAASTAVSNRRSEDPYSLDDVWAAAERIAEGAGSLYSSAFSGGDGGIYTAPSVKPKVEDNRDAEIAIMKDDYKIGFKTTNEAIARLERSLVQMSTNLSQGAPSRNTEREPSSRQYRESNNSMSDQLCYHCSAPGHRSNNCPTKERQFAEGKIKLNAEGKIRLTDGAELPSKGEGLSLAERIEKHWRGRTPVKSVAQNLQIPVYDKESGTPEEFNNFIESLKIASDNERRETTYVQLLQRESKSKKKFIPMDYDSESESETEEVDYSSVDWAKVASTIGPKKLKSLISSTRNTSRNEDF